MAMPEMRRNGNCEKHFFGKHSNYICREQAMPNYCEAARLDIQCLEVRAMSKLQCVARIKIHAGRLDEF